MKQPLELPADWVELGDRHRLRFQHWAPDFTIPENAAKWAHLSRLIREQPIVGATVAHILDNGEDCWGSITFNTDLTRAGPFRDDEKWNVDVWEPLTLAPSLLCHCGDHGFIRGGRWVRA